MIPYGTGNLKKLEYYGSTTAVKLKKNCVMNLCFDFQMTVSITNYYHLEIQRNSNSALKGSLTITSGLSVR